MNIKEKAKQFAINAHQGQVRKNEPDKPMIVHPIGVALLLEEYGCDDAVIAAGYLHDVVEDTKYTIKQIERNFGPDIASLVNGASEPDKSLSWEERKKHTIKITRDLPLRNKLVICADKINNLESLYLKFTKTGERDFKQFNRGEEEQKWYYTNVYRSLVFHEDENLPIFKRLKQILEFVFERKEDVFLKNTIFQDNPERYEQLKKLHSQKIELQQLKALTELPKPFVIEFTGSPRTGKTSTINDIKEFFQKGGFKVRVIEEFTTSTYYKENLKPNLDSSSIKDRDIAIAECVYIQLYEAAISNYDIVIVDRSLNDRQIWNYSHYKKGNISEKTYLELKKRYSKLSKELIDFLIITYTDPITSLKRDYNSSLAFEARNFLNVANLEDYNNALESLKDLFQESVEEAVLIDATSKSLNDISVETASSIMPLMRKRYIDNFKDSLNKKS